MNVGLILTGAADEIRCHLNAEQLIGRILVSFGI
jgi:hypothetical protein